MRYFAEWLANLNDVSLSIESEDGVRNQISYVSNRKLVFQSAGCVSEVINLPVEVERFDFTWPEAQISVRFKLKVKANQRPEYSSALTIPPSCGCGSPLTGTVKWKQLPSEHWAEMMDLWHCHKPSSPTDSTIGMYSLAMHGFHPKPGLAYYSATYYLIHPSDLLSASHASECGLLDRLLKTEKQGSTTLKLWRWDLSKDAAVSPVFSLMLAELIDAHANFTFIINTKLIVWVLNTCAEYTFTGSNETMRGAKILYGDPKELVSKRPDPEDVTLPDEAFERLIVELEETSARLPSSVRSIGGWKLSLLGGPDSISGTPV